LARQTEHLLGEFASIARSPIGTESTLAMTAMAGPVERGLSAALSLWFHEMTILIRSQASS
jgi:hypothetical protein